MKTYLPELERTIVGILESIVTEGYGAYQNPFDCSNNLTDLMYKEMKEKGIEKYSDEWYKIENHYEDKILEIANKFWEM